MCLKIREFRNFDRFNPLDNFGKQKGKRTARH